MQKKTIDRKELISIREYRLGDRNFILATWLRGLYYGDSWFSQIPKNIFMTNHHAALEKVVNNPNTKIKVACLKDDPDTILGYSVFRIVNGDLVALDWVFTKSNWRNIGIASLLVPAQTKAYTQTTKAGSAIVREKYPHLIFNPYLFG